MNAGATTLLLTRLYNMMFGGITYTFPSTYYIGLWCNALDKDSTNKTPGEVIADSYVRAELKNDATGFSEIIGNEKRNLATVLFPLAEQDWGIVSYTGILDAATGGNLLFFSQLSTPTEVVSGDQFRFPPASLRFVLPVTPASLAGLHSSEFVENPTNNPFSGGIR